MPRFFFDLCDDGGLHRDHVGESFDDVDAAGNLVAIMLADMVNDAPYGCLGQDVACDVRDEAGRAVYRGELTFRAFRLSPG